MEDWGSGGDVSSGEGRTDVRIVVRCGSLFEAQAESYRRGEQSMLLSSYLYSISSTQLVSVVSLVAVAASNQPLIIGLSGC